MFSKGSQPLSPDKIRGWILDAYPTGEGEIAVWVISETGERIRLIDTFHPNIYVSGKQDEIERLASRFYSNNDIAKWSFAQKYAHPTDTQKSRVLEITLKDYRKASHFTREILRIGDYLKYQVHNCDLHADCAYIFSKDLFPLALVEIKNQPQELTYKLQDTVASTNYVVPPLRIMRLKVKIAQKGKVGNFEDPIDEITLTQAEKQVTIDSNDEADKLLKLVDVVCELDPDIILTHGGDSYLFPYLIQRALVNNVSDKMLLSRDPLLSRLRLHPEELSSPTDAPSTNRPRNAYSDAST